MLTRLSRIFIFCSGLIFSAASWSDAEENQTQGNHMYKCQEGCKDIFGDVEDNNSENNDREIIDYQRTEPQGDDNHGYSGSLSPIYSTTP